VTTYDRDTYFDKVRDSLFYGSMNQDQVEGQENLLTQWENRPYTDVRWLAYILATTIHETAATMQPITEYGSQSYLQGKPYWPYIGRGYVQLTWEDNYAKARDKLGLSGSDDLVKYPDRALDPVIAADVIFLGMAEGWFTGKALPDYFNDSKDDPVNARQIVNGNDDDDLIAGYHRKFLDALKASAEEGATIVPPTPADPDMPDVQVAIYTKPGAVVTVQLNGETVFTNV
jgi:putative chitinase